MSRPRLHWKDRANQEQVLELAEGVTTIGRRSDSNVVIDNPHVSRHHLQIVRESGGCKLLDSHSAYGTFVNGTRVDQHVLQHGDRIELGKDRVEVFYFEGAGSMPQEQRNTSTVFAQSIMDVAKSLAPHASDLEKISVLLNLQSQWQESFTPNVAFSQILESAIRISGAERGFVLTRSGGEYVYAVGQDGKGRNLSESEFEASQGVVRQVAESGQPVFMVGGIEGDWASRDSIVRMNLRAVACLPLEGIPVHEEKTAVLGILYLDSTKPMHALSGLDQRILTKLAVEAGNVVERVEVIKSFEEKRIMERELSLAEETQKSLLPNELPEFEHAAVMCFSKPTRYVSGDFYDVMRLENGSLIAVLADVSGKGIPASLLSSMLLGCLRLQLRTGVTLDRAIKEINALMCESSSANRFVTVFVFLLDATGSGRFISAGHNTAYVYRRATGHVDELQSTSPLVGAFDFVTFESAPLEMKEGDVIVVFSDGLTEAENTQGELLGEETVKNLIRTHGAAGAAEVQTQLLNHAWLFTTGRDQSDDITLVVVEKR